MGNKLVVFDIECKVDFIRVGQTQRADGKNAYLLAFNYYLLDIDKPKFKITPRDVQGLSIHQTKSFKKSFCNDKDLTKYAYDVLTHEDVVGWVGHYSTEFDVPIINTRLQFHGFPILPQMPHEDTMKVFKSAKGKVALASYKLDYLAEFYGLERKTKVIEKDWVLARAGHVPELIKVATYGKQDIVVTTALYEIARKLNGARIDLFSRFNKNAQRCAACGSHNLQKRGTLRTKTRLRPQLQCTDCGKWDYGPDIKPSVA